MKEKTRKKIQNTIHKAVEKLENIQQNLDDKLYTEYGIQVQKKNKKNEKNK